MVPWIVRMGPVLLRFCLTPRGPCRLGLPHPPWVTGAGERVAALGVASPAQHVNVLEPDHFAGGFPSPRFRAVICCQVVGSSTLCTEWLELASSCRESLPSVVIAALVSVAALSLGDPSSCRSPRRGSALCAIGSYLPGVSGKRLATLGTDRAEPLGCCLGGCHSTRVGQVRLVRVPAWG